MAKGRKGQVLLLALMIMFVGAVILTGLFQYLGTSLLLATRGEENAVNYYAADSGIEDTILWLQHKPWDTPSESLAGWKACDPLSQTCGNDYEINGRDVNVSIENPIGFDKDTFLITSNATNDNGVRTTIESYINIEYYELSMFGYGAITSNTFVTIQPGSTVDGNVSVPDADEGLVINKGTLNGEVIDLPGPWPTADQLKEMFLPTVDESDHFPWPFIDVKDTPTIESLYRDGHLQIYSKKKDQIATLNGTVYVTNNLDIGQTNQNFTLDLHGQAIFVEGEIDIGGKTTIKGSGFIIAIGDIFFLPTIATEEGNYVFLMSIDGTIKLQPNGEFHGSVIGEAEVTTQPGYGIEWTDPNAAGIEFPVIDTLKVLTYDIVDR